MPMPKHITLLVVAALAACSTEASDGEPAETESSGGTENGSTEASEAEAGPSGEASGSSTPSSTTSDPDSGDPSTSTTSVGETTAGSDESSSGEVSDEPGPDFRMLGPHPVETTSGEESLPTDCTMSYTIVAPTDVEDAPVVFLAHGFQSTGVSMAGWAEHWASWGLTVVTPDLCHSEVFDAQHDKNGTDMVALRDALGLGDTLWAGHSAGGLSAVVAAANDPSAVSLLGLDMTDGDSIGLDAAPGVSVPGYNLVGEAGQCNSDGNGVGVFSSVPNGRAVRINEADHCDFQNPVDPLCNLCTEPNDTITAEQINATIFGMSTGFLVWQAGLDNTGRQWWEEGRPYYDELAAAGIVASIF